jgi:hypothetical protein
VGALPVVAGFAMGFRYSTEETMAAPKKTPVTITLDPPDLDQVKRLAERERSSSAGVIRRLLVERLHALQNAEQSARAA